MNDTYYQAVTPSREQFHREYAGEVRLTDFNTTYPNNWHKQEYTMLEKIHRKQLQERGEPDAAPSKNTKICL